MSLMTRNGAEGRPKHGKGPSASKLKKRENEKSTVLGRGARQQQFGSHAGGGALRLERDAPSRRVQGDGLVLVEPEGDPRGDGARAAHRARQADGAARPHVQLGRSADRRYGC